MTGVRPEENRPESVRPHLEPLSASGAAPGMEPRDLVEEKEKEYSERREGYSESKEENNIRGKSR